MKKYLNLSVFAIVLSSLTFTSCSNDDELQKSFKSMPVQFSAGLHVASVTRSLQSDYDAGVGANSPFKTTSIGDVWVQDGTQAGGDKVFLISVNDKNGAATTTTTGYEYYVSSAPNALTPSTTANQFFWMKSSEVKGVVAWSHGKTTTLAASDFDLDNTNHNLEFDLKTAAGVSDQSTSWNNELLWGYTVINEASSGSAQDLKLYHQLARIDVILVVTGAPAAPQLYIGRKDATAPVSEVRLALNGAFTPPLDHEKGYDMNTIVGSALNENWGATTPTASSQQGTWAAAATPEVGYIKPWLSSTTNPASPTFPCDFTQYYSAVVVPSVSAGTTYLANKFVLFQIDVDGVKYKYIPTVDTTFLPGKRYLYKITVAPSGINVTATIQNWSHTGDATDEFTGSAGLD